MNKSIRIIITSLILSILWTLLSAWSISDHHFGNRFMTFDARSFSMGNANAYNTVSPFAITTNPANLTLLRASYGTQLGLNLTRNEDNRAIPLYNSFDAYVDDATYSSNIYTFEDFSGIAFGKLGDRNSIGLAVFHQPLLNFEGDYYEEVRNNRNQDNDVYPEVIAKNQINNDGVLYQSGLAYSLGYMISEHANLNLGLSYAMLKGTADRQVRINWTDWAVNTMATAAPATVLPDSLFEVKTELEGQRLQVGTAFTVNHRLGIGISYAFKSTLDRIGDQKTVHGVNTTETAIDGKFILPSELRVGFCYVPRNVMRTTFNLDVEKVAWSNVNPAYEDVYNFYVGTEHHVENRLPLRIGFQSVNTYHSYVESRVMDGNPVDIIFARKIITPMFSIGSGAEIMKNLSWDIGFGYAWRSYEALDLFRDRYYNYPQLWVNPQYINLKDRGWDNPDKVKESFVTISTGITLTW